MTATGSAPLTAAELTQPPKIELRRLPALVAAAVRLVLAAAPREFLLVTALQAVAGLGLVLPLVGGHELLTRVLAGDARGALPQAVVVLGLLGAIGVATAVAASRDDVLSELVNRHAMGRILDVACAADLEQFERPDFHNRLERASMSARIRPHQLVQGLGALGAALMATAGVALALATIEPWLVPATLLAGVPLWLASLKSGQLLFDALFRLTPAERERSYLLDVLTDRRSAVEVRAFGLAPYLRRRWDRRTDERLTEIRRTAHRRLRVTLAARFVSGLALAAVVGPVVALAAAGRMPVADAGAAVTAVLLLASRLRTGAAGTDQLFEAAPFIDDMGRFLEPPGAVAAPRPAPPPFRRLTVENLSFTYPSSDRPALCGIDLEIHAGQVVALVGENGSGKTTLAKLLSHLYRPQSGHIRYDGVDVADVDPDALRASIAVLFQDYLRYLLSAADNVAMGRWQHTADDAAVEHAAAMAGADPFLRALPNGYATLLGPQFAGGVDLSGGQWQRVALARAFFRDAPFVILDEPTATLDARAEHDLFQRLRTLLADRTVLLVSHRFNTVREADHIYVLANGRIAEHGTHSTLLKANGPYADLYTLQASTYQDPA
ncbi:ABC transporter ATP-binding protein [Actinomadura flavalba]|uniref:ABC transporter ATP-binding protein n=1 Tax=Actinomadura flavalba TaxID=1120938 RepID=UPI00035E2599|nr:ABC transporter ATP-binding protein [Actinomadura flavalba]